MNNTYLLINILTLSFPLIFSFQKRISYYKKWPFLFPSLIVTAILFLIWDHFFIRAGIWGFNPVYIKRIYVTDIPLEEILFFICIPFSSIFIYTALNTYFADATTFNKYSKKITYCIIATAIMLTSFNTERTYTFFVSLALVFLLCLQIFFVRGNYMGRFYRFFAVQLIPFAIVNGILTGSYIKDEVVWYNSQHITGVRLGTIPVEDALYSMSLMLMNIMFMEYLEERKKRTV